jgi:hypothetical protein
VIRKNFEIQTNLFRFLFNFADLYIEFSSLMD